MKQFVLFMAFAIMPILVSGQSDMIYLHNGKTIQGKVNKISEQTVLFTYEGEDAEQTLGKYAIAKIVYGKSGREQEVSEKIEIKNSDDWEKVLIIEDLDAVTGMNRIGEVKGKTSAYFNYRSAAGNDRKSEENLKKMAAEMGCPFILLTADKSAGVGYNQSGNVGQQQLKKGIAYKY